MSLTSTNQVETNKYELEIAVDKENFQDAVSKVYHKNVSKMNVPGFRRGKAPRSIVEKYYGKGVFYEDAVNMLYPEAYENAVKESGIEPVSRADVEVVKLDDDGFVFKAKVTVKPEVEVGEYKGLKATKKVKAVTDADVDGEVERVRNRNARLITVEDRPAQKGDIAVIDYDGSIDGVPFQGGKAEKQNLELGSGQFIEGFEDQVVGHKAGDEFSVNVTFPQDYGAKELAGKAAVFQVKLHEIQKRELPAVDDEFAKDVSEFDTLAEYKDDIRHHLEERYDHEAQDDVENQLIDQVISGMKAEIPEVMYENSVDSFVTDFDYRLQSQGLNLQTYLKYTGMEMDAFRKTFREQAERQVKVRLALEKIADLEHFEATDADMEKELKKLADQYHIDVEKAKKAIREKDVKADIVVNKAVDLIRDSAQVTTEELKPEEPKEESKSKPEAPKEKSESKAAKPKEETGKAKKDKKTAGKTAKKSQKSAAAEEKAAE